MTNMVITWVCPSITIDHLFGWEKNGALRSLSRKICKTRWISSCRWVWTSHRKCCVTNCSRLFSGLSTLCLLSLILILPSRIHPIKPPTVFLGIAGLAPAEKTVGGGFGNAECPSSSDTQKFGQLVSKKMSMFFLKKSRTGKTWFWRLRKTRDHSPSVAAFGTPPWPPAILAPHPAWARLICALEGVVMSNMVFPDSKTNQGPSLTALNWLVVSTHAHNIQTKQKIRIFAVFTRMCEFVDIACNTQNPWGPQRRTRSVKASKFIKSLLCFRNYSYWKRFLQTYMMMNS